MYDVVGPQARDRPTGRRISLIFKVLRGLEAHEGRLWFHRRRYWLGWFRFAFEHEFVGL